MNIAEKLAAEIGEEKPVSHQRTQAAPAVDGIFRRANGVSTIQVLDRLGISHHESNRGEMATCPGCGEEGALVCKDGGLKCLHDRCAHAGPKGMPGFRSNVDLVAHVQQLEPKRAASAICEWFDVDLAASDRASRDEDYLPEPPEGLFDEEPVAKEPPRDPFIGRFEFLSDTTLLSAPPPRRYLLKRCGVGFLPQGKAGMLVGAGGVGKTLFECQLALSVALGRAFLGVLTVAEPGPVLLALAEEEPEEIHRRLHAAAASMGLSRDERLTATRAIVALAMAGTNVALTSGDGKGNVDTTATRDWLWHHIEQARVDWKLIVLDPLSRWAGNDVEKDSHAATRFVETVESFTKAPGNPTVLVAHHSNKGSRRVDAPMGGAEASRGATALTDGVRWVANLDADGPHVVAVRVTKNNYAPPSDPIYLLRDLDHGGALRPMSAAELADHEEARQQSKPRRGGREPVSDAILDERIRQAVEKHGPQPSLAALKRCGVRGNDQRLTERATLLGAIGCVSAESKGRAEA
jgi:hypothetical protein